MSQISYGTITITDITDIDTIKNWYLATSASSGVTKSTSGWTDTIQQMTSTKQYLWNYEQILGANNTEISSTDPVIIGRYGQNGQSGADGNSITSIDEYYQATNSTTNPGASGWQKNTIVVPTSTNKYLWNYQVINYSKTAAEGTYADARIIGIYGDTGPQGPQGNPGAAGINTATVYLYQRATSAPTKPSGTLTYTFSSAKITSGTLGNWKQSIGELTGTNPIWVIAAVASSNGTTDAIASTDWSTQIKLAQDGTNGLNQATVYIYKRAASATAPSATTYTFSNGSFTVPSGWSKKIPASSESNKNPCWVTSAVAIGSGTTATLNWVAPSVLVENGSDGFSPRVVQTSNGVQIIDAEDNVTTITNGINGISYYTHILYSSKDSPTSSSDVSSSPTGKSYVGIQTTTSPDAPSWNDSNWKWMKYIGNNGTSITISSIQYAKSTTDSQPSSGWSTTVPTVGEGEWLWTMTTYSDNSKVYTKSKQGKSGSSVSVSKTEYQSGTSPTTAPTGSWSTSIPSVAEGNYLWTKTTYSDGNYSYTVAKQGKSGTSVTISNTSVKYQVGTSATTAPTGTWQDSVQPTTAEGQYLWTRTIVTYSDSSSTTSYSVAAHGAGGTSVSISSIKYATSSTETQPADSSFNTSVPTVSEGHWLWTMTTYSNGSKMYTKSKQGKSGTNGVSVTKTRELYYLKTDTSTVPTITATSQITATDRQNGWTSVVPTYVPTAEYWTCIETSLSTGGPVWSTPVKNIALTDESYRAWEAVSISQDSNENAQGAMSQAAAAQYATEALAAKVKHFWWDPDGAHAASGINRNNVTEGIVSTYGFNSLVGVAGITFGYNSYKAIEIDGGTPALKLYKPSKTAQGAQTAELNANGLVLSEGGVKSGSVNAGNSGFVYLSTEDYGTALTIGDGANKTDWRLILGTKFGVDDEGNLYGTSVNLSGKIVATQGTIGGASITNGVLQVTNANISGTIEAGKINASILSAITTNIGTITAGVIKHDTVGGTGGIWFSADTNTSSNVTVGTSGARKDWRLLVANTFGVTTAGNVYATSANLTGAINATSGTIGSNETGSKRWQIGSTSIFNGPNAIDADVEGTYIGTNGIRNFKDTTHYVTITNGKITALDADISGTIYANSGNIGGATISNNVLSIASGYIGTATSGFTIDSYGFYSGSKTGTTAGYLTISNTDFTRTINNVSRSDLRFAIGSKFGVDKNGNLYADGGYLTNLTISTDKIESSSGSTSYAQISTSGLVIKKGNVQVANFGDSITLGQSTKGYTYITSTGMDIYAGSDNTNLVHFGYDSGTNSSGGTSIAPYYTFGTRQSGGTIGNYSIAEGINVEASGYASHAEGYTNHATGLNSHAEGAGSTASGVRSHVEGQACEASGRNSHAQNRGAHASGENSHASGYYTTAGYENQTAIGKYNYNNSTNLFEIGNGTSESARSNAFSIDSSGNLRIAGKVYIQGTGDLTDATELTGGGSSSGGETKTGSTEWDSSDSTYTKLYLTGARVQNTSPTTYSDSKVYINNNHHLYSNGKQVVNLSDSQALTNKTYNGYTLGAACAKGVVTSVDTSASLPTSNAVKTFVEGKGYATGTIPTIKLNGSTTTSPTFYAPTSAGTSGYYLKSNGSGAPTWAAISSNISGSGTSGYLTKWNGSSSLTNGPQLGSSTTTFLRNDGTWATPSVGTFSSSVLVRETKSFSYTVSGNNTDGTKTYTKSGYTPIGIVGYDSGSGGVGFVILGIQSASTGSVTVKYNLRRFASSSVTATAYIDILWLKV